MYICKITIVSSAPINEITTFLKSITNNSSEERYFCDDWEVNIDKTWVETMGSLHFQRTEITFFGREEIVNRQIKAFRLRFLSAGG